MGHGSEDDDICAPGHAIQCHEVRPISRRAPMINDEDRCPECDRCLGDQPTCSCGWKRDAKVEARACPRCRQRPASSFFLGEEGHICGACWNTEHSSKPTDRCTEPGCTKTAQDHIEEFRRIVARPEWQEKFGSRRPTPVITPSSDPS